MMPTDYPHNQKTLDTITPISADHERVIGRSGVGDMCVVSDTPAVRLGGEL